MINILIVDDEVLIREGLKILLAVYDDLNIVGLCGDGEEAYVFCQDQDVDVVLMDIRMEKCDGVMATKLIKSLEKNIKILILTTFKDNAYITSALSCGANGYLLKDSSSEKIYEALKNVYLGNAVVHPEVLDNMINNQKDSSAHCYIMEKYGLSTKEIELIKLIAEGMNNKEISKVLFLAEGTVKNMISTILSKLQLRDRTQIAIFAFKNELVG